MKFTIGQSHEGATRTITVQVLADQGKQLQRVITKYDGFVEDDDTLPPCSSYETVVRKQEGLSPNQKHTVVVEATHTDTSRDSGVKSWLD